MARAQALGRDSSVFKFRAHQDPHEPSIPDHLRQDRLGNQAADVVAGEVFGAPGVEPVTADVVNLWKLQAAVAKEVLIVCAAQKAAPACPHDFAFVSWGGSASCTSSRPRTWP